jgi:SsrA-binding protein
MSIKILHNNKKAFHNFAISDRWEAGLALMGTEVKALRQAKVNLGDGWVDIENGEAFLREVRIGHYSHGNVHNHEEMRRRKLLLKKKEIIVLTKHIEQKGATIVPLKIYFKDNLVKVEIGLAKGKKDHDKRESAKEKDARRDIDRELKKRR